mgnify:CR=1 FL=1
MSKSINFIAPINQFGYGIAGTNIVKAAEEEGLRLNLIPLSVEIPESESGVKVTVAQAIERGTNFDGKAPSVRMYHQFDLALHCGNPRYGFPFFELDSFTPRELHHLKNQDELIVASKWAVDVIKNNGIELPTHVVPLGVDRSIFYDEDFKHEGTTVFFNVGKWEIRKGHDILIEAFEKAFTKDDDVKLVMACCNPFLNPTESKEWIFRYTNGKLGDKVVVYPHRLAGQREVAKLMRDGDVGVFPARAEGWNLDMLEAMSCGKHIITTRNTAHTEFCNEANSIMIDTPEKEKAYDGKWFFEQGSWHKIGTKEIDQLAEAMRYFHKQKQMGSLDKNLAGVDTARQFSWSNTVQTMWRHIHG